MDKKIAVLPGDGIGEEVMAQCLRVVSAIAGHFGHSFEYSRGLVGGAAYDVHSCHLPEETIAICKASDAVLFGSVGGPVADQHMPKWVGCEQKSILAIRKAFNFSVNLRPVKLFKGLEDSCPLKDSIIGTGIDIFFVRELRGDAYFGKKETTTVSGMRCATDQAEYTEKQVKAAAHAAFGAARKRKGKVTSVDKANVMETSRLWRQVMREVAAEYPDVTLEEMLVDNCAMQMMRNPSQFDVVVTTNMFGDILTDEAAVLAGSLGMLASASLNEEGFGLYEPAGGSAPDVAGKGTANPIAQILCAALMLDHSFGLTTEAQAIVEAVKATIADGYRTPDLVPAETTGNQSGFKIVGTAAMTDAIIARLSCTAERSPGGPGKRHRAAAIARSTRQANKTGIAGMSPAPSISPSKLAPTPTVSKHVTSNPISFAVPGNSFDPNFVLPLNRY